MKSKIFTLSKTGAQVLKTLGMLIRAARIERGMSQGELAERLGVSRYTVMGIEKGDPKVAGGRLIEAAVIVGIPILASSERELEQVSSTAASLIKVLPERVGAGRKDLDDDY
jgi:transcriptional regulator with XRE-family HTH domain